MLPPAGHEVEKEELGGGKEENVFFTVYVMALLNVFGKQQKPRKQVALLPEDVTPVSVKSILQL